MKSLTYIVFLLLITVSQSIAQKIGLNITSPAAPVHMVQPPGTTLGGTQPLLFSEYTGTNLADAIAIKGKCTPADYYGLGGDFEGGYVGVQGRITSGLNQNYIGVRGDVAGTGNGNFYGTYANAHASGNNFAVYGTATGGVKNWAGFFASGNVHIQNRFAIGNINPLYTVHVNQPVGTTLSGNVPVMHVEYTGSNVDDVIAIRGRCFLPSSKGIGGQFEGGEVGVRGQINTSASGAHFAVQGMVDANNGTNVAIFGDANGFDAVNYAGYFGNGMVYIDDDLGVGRDPVTNRLEVNGNASKSSAGDWLANSDVRLKKNIQPLDERQMIEKLLALKGIAYEWNDDKTGNERPEGMQYGFSAQNIQEVFPTLVEEDANGYLQTAYGTYDAITVEAIRFLYLENQQLKEEIKEIRQMLEASNTGN